MSLYGPVFVIFVLLTLHLHCTFCQLKQKIEKLEKANLAEKPWQMSGEAGGKVRPINSLLEEDISFDHTTVTGNLRFLFVKIY